MIVLMIACKDEANFSDEDNNSTARKLKGRGSSERSNI